VRRKVTPSSGNGEVEPGLARVAVSIRPTARQFVLTGGAAAGAICRPAAQRRSVACADTRAAGPPIPRPKSGFLQTRPLAGKLGVVNLSQIAFVPAAQMEGDGIEQGADLRGSERVISRARQAPARHGLGALVIITRSPPAQPRQAEALLSLSNFFAWRESWVGGVAFEHLGSDRTPLRPQNTVDDLKLPSCRHVNSRSAQLAAPALEPGRGDV